MQWMTSCSKWLPARTSDWPSLSCSIVQIIQYYCSTVASAWYEDARATEVIQRGIGFGGQRSDTLGASCYLLMIHISSESGQFQWPALRYIRCIMLLMIHTCISSESGKFQWSSTIDIHFERMTGQRFVIDGLEYETAENNSRILHRAKQDFTNVMIPSDVTVIDRNCFWSHAQLSAPIILQQKVGYDRVRNRTDCWTNRHLWLRIIFCCSGGDIAAVCLKSCDMTDVMSNVGRKSSGFVMHEQGITFVSKSSPSEYMVTFSCHSEDAFEALLSPYSHVQRAGEDTVIESYSHQSGSIYFQ
jgi:hypothetical protein